MPRRGTFYAVTPEEAEQLLSLVGNDAELSCQVLELHSIERQKKRFIAPVDHAWEILHRCLSDGSVHTVGKGETPLARCVLGGKSLYGGKDYIVCYVAPEQAAEAAIALDEIDQQWLINRYKNLHAAGYIGRLDNEDFEYTWDNFTNMRNLYTKAAADGRAVVFVTDQ
jgi:hypothetical protein